MKNRLRCRHIVVFGVSAGSEAASARSYSSVAVQLRHPGQWRENAVRQGQVAVQKALIFDLVVVPSKVHFAVRGRLQHSGK